MALRKWPCSESHTKVTHLEDVNGGLVDGADDSAAGVNCVANCSHDYCGSTRVQPCQIQRAISRSKLVVEFLLEVETTRAVQLCSSSWLHHGKDT